MESSSFFLDIQEIRRPESTYRLQVYWWSSIRDVKRALRELTHEPPSRQHLYHSTNPSELSNSLMLHDIGIEKSGRMLRVAIDYVNQGDFVITPTKDVLLDDASKAMVENVRRGFQRNKVPTATDEFEGSGGVYFLRNAFGSYEAVFKPHDEEQGMPNNPKDRVGTGVEGLREHFQPGQGCLRELAAYIMDHKHFSSVPPTTLVHCEHPTFHYPVHGQSSTRAMQDKPFPKLGSLQKFIRGAELFEDLGPSKLSDFEVQKIALLDIRLLNGDRNAANILVQHVHEHGSDPDSEGEPYSHDREFVVSGSPNARGDHMLHEDVYHLIPIDHGYAMPSHLKIFEWDWTWFNYSHVDRPVHPDILDYMKALDINVLLKRLTAQVALSDDSIFLLRLSHFLITEAFAVGLTLKDIANIVARVGYDESIPSRLEQAIEEAEDNAYRSIEMKTSRSKSISPYFYDSPGRSSVDLTPCNKKQCSNSFFKPGEDSDMNSGDFFEDDADFNSSHALNHSPMRPQLAKTTSCNLLASFSSHEPSPPVTSTSQFQDLREHLPVGPPPFHGLAPIVEGAARRERGLSSLSNQSYESAQSSNSCGVEDLKDGGWGCSNTYIDSLGAGHHHESRPSSALRASFQGMDENKGEPHRNEEGGALKKGIAAVKKSTDLTVDIGNGLLGAKVDMGGMPLRSLRSVDGYALTRARTPGPSSASDGPIFSNKKKQKVGSDDEAQLVRSLNAALPSPSEFGRCNGSWSTFADKTDITRQISVKTPSCSREASGNNLLPQKPPLSKSSSDATSTEMQPSWAASGDDDGDYTFFTFESKEEDLEQVDCLEYCPREMSGGTTEDHLMLTSDYLFDVPLPESIPLTRVVSFSGFESNLMYSNQSMRNMGNLRLERRRAISESKEFKQLRQEFAERQVTSIVQRVAAAKKRNM